MGPRRLSDPSLAAGVSPSPDAVVYKAEGGGEVEIHMNGHASGNENEASEGVNVLSDTSGCSTVDKTASDTSTSTVVCQQPGGSSRAPGLTNGHSDIEDSSSIKEESDSHPCDSSIVEEINGEIGSSGHRKEGSPYNVRIGGRSSVEGSTETLTGWPSDYPRSQPSPSTLRRPLNANSSAANMSTSTSDISDSRVGNSPACLDTALLSLSIAGPHVTDAAHRQLLLNGTGSASCTAAGTGAALRGTGAAGALRVDIGRCQSAAGHSTDSEASGSPSPGVESKVRYSSP